RTLPGRPRTRPRARRSLQGCAYLRVPQALDLPCTLLLGEDAADPHLEPHAPAAADVDERVLAREGGERLVALDREVHVGDAHVQVARDVEVALQRGALRRAHLDLQAGQLVDALRLGGPRVAAGPG